MVEKSVLLSHAHLLRAAHQIVELNEAATIHDSLTQSKIQTETAKEQIKGLIFYVCNSR